MQVFESIDSAQLTGPTYLTIGNFDGMHRGHRALIQAMLAAARRQGAACGLLTFHPHPRSVLQPNQAVTSIASLYERMTLYGEAGLDFAIIHPFTTDTAQTEAEDFLHLLLGHLAVTRLWVGPDFALGRGRRGDVPFLQEAGKRLGIVVEVYPEYHWEGQPVRSSSIRRLLEIGNVEWAAAWLGRHYSISGIVGRGVARGHTLGFPTANLSITRGRVVPANGVYATWTWLDGQRLPSVTNIGVRPTVSGTHRTVEAHIIDFDADIYGRCLRLEFVTRLRDEMKFPGLDALRQQITRDRDRAAALLQSDPQAPQMQRFQELAHTADWAVRILAADLPDLYAHAALTMFALQGAAFVDGPTVQQHIEIEAADREDLLVRWLSELLWHSEIQGVMFQQFWIEEVSDTSLRALALGRAGRSELAHIKAVTYHDLRILEPSEAESGGWEAMVLFDT